MDTVTQRRTCERGYLLTCILTCILTYMYSCICRERAEKRKKKGKDMMNMKDKRGEGIKRRIKTLRLNIKL